MTKKLALSNLYRHSPEELHTGSDSCKMNVHPDSIFASYSYKYFGKGKGVPIYTLGFPPKSAIKDMTPL